MIIIPDIHGRTFWKDAIKDRESEDIIFLGDYLDPYAWENISEDKVISNFKEIIEFKKSHMNNVTLLLGNHDFGPYISTRMVGCRTLSRVQECRDIFNENRNLFKVADYRKIGDNNYSFSHSAILPMWVRDESVSYPGRDGIFYDIRDNINIQTIIDTLNEDWVNGNPNLFIGLGIVGFSRGGWADAGSCVWADVREVARTLSIYEDSYQIFGHSQQMKDPIITDYWACLDCRRAFELTEDGKLTPITKEDSLDNYR